MKRGIAILLAALLLGLCACSPTGADASEPGGTQPVTQPATRGTETTAGTQQTQPSAQETDPTAETPEEPEINEAFTAAVPDAPEGALGVMFNEPLDGLELTVTQNGPAGEYDRAYIVAKYVGSWVNVFGVTWESGRLNVGDKALYSFRTGQGDVISGSFDRPDGGAMYYLTVTAPDGSDFGEYLTYNGRWARRRRNISWTPAGMRRRSCARLPVRTRTGSSMTAVSFRTTASPMSASGWRARRSGMRWSRRTARASMPPSSTPIRIATVLPAYFKSK